MARIGLAFRAFFRILGDRGFADEVDRLAQGRALPAVAPAPAPASAPAPAAPSAEAPRPAARSDALTLLAVLQREARFVDFVKESIAGYADAQVGAAVRDVHRDCAAALDRLFGLQPVNPQPEGSAVELPAGYDAARVRLTGNVAGQPPFRGRLRHPGWEATRCQMPEWSGGEAAARVVAPAEVEIP